MQAAALQLARTRSAFDTWRAIHPGRQRIPEQLWHMALQLLAEHSLSRVARELRLSPKYLRRRQLSADHPLAQPPQFLQLPAALLQTASVGPATQLSSPRQAAQTDVRVVLERPDGSRLVLSLPTLQWSQIASLFSDFLHH